MRRVVASTLLLLLSGCSVKSSAPDTYLVDVAGDAEPRYDLVAANFTELNGSLVLRIEVRNYAAGLPLLEARISASNGDSYARLVADPKKPTVPQVRAEAGRLQEGRYVDAYDTCWLPSFPTNPDSQGPWLLFLEFLHNRTGLTNGGSVRSLTLNTTNVNGTLQDEANHEGLVRIKGGENPYRDLTTSCPLTHQRDRLA